MNKREMRENMVLISELEQARAEASVAEHSIKKLMEAHQKMAAKMDTMEVENYDLRSKLVQSEATVEHQVSIQGILNRQKQAMADRVQGLQEQVNVLQRLADKVPTRKIFPKVDTAKVLQEQLRLLQRAVQPQQAGSKERHFSDSKPPTTIKNKTISSSKTLMIGKSNAIMQSKNLSPFPPYYRKEDATRPTTTTTTSSSQPDTNEALSPSQSHKLTNLNYEDFQRALLSEELNSPIAPTSKRNSNDGSRKKQSIVEQSKVRHTTPGKGHPSDKSIPSSNEGVVSTQNNFPNLMRRANDKRSRDPISFQKVKQQSTLEYTPEIKSRRPESRQSEIKADIFDLHSSHRQDVAGMMSQFF